MLIPGIVAIVLLVIALILVLAGIQTIAGVPVLSAGQFAAGYLAAGNFAPGIFALGNFAAGFSLQVYSRSMSSRLESFLSEYLPSVFSLSVSSRPEWLPGCTCTINTAGGRKKPGNLNPEKNNGTPQSPFLFPGSRAKSTYLMLSSHP